VQLAKC